MSKAKLDQVFNLNNSDEVFSFMKDYAHKNQDLSAALIRHFLPDSIDPDSLRVEVRNIIFAVDESGHRWGPSLSESKSPTLESRKSLTKEEEKDIKLRRRVNLFRDSRPRWRKCTAREK